MNNVLVLVVLYQELDLVPYIIPCNTVAVDLSDKTVVCNNYKNEARACGDDPAPIRPAAGRSFAL